MKLTWPRLLAWKPCPEAVVWGHEQFDGTAGVPLCAILTRLETTGHWPWANWLIVRVMTRPQ